MTGGQWRFGLAASVSITPLACIENWPREVVYGTNNNKTE